MIESYAVLARGKRPHDDLKKDRCPIVLGYKDTDCTWCRDIVKSTSRYVVTEEACYRRRAADGQLLHCRQRTLNLVAYHEATGQTNMAKRNCTRIKSD